MEQHIYYIAVVNRAVGWTRDASLTYTLSQTHVSVHDNGAMVFQHLENEQFY